MIRGIRSREPSLEAIQQHQSVRASSSTAKCIQPDSLDITVTAEFCASCPRVLGQGDDEVARVFIVEPCTRVCNHLILANHSNMLTFHL